MKVTVQTNNNRKIVDVSTKGVSTKGKDNSYTIEVEVDCHDNDSESGKDSGGEDDVKKVSSVRVLLLKGACLLVYLSVVCVWNFQTYASDQLSDSADAALAQVAKATKSGDLLSVWYAYEKLFNHPNRQDVDARLFLSCFRMSGCFHLDTLSNILGKSRSDIRELIRGFCPHFSSWKNRIRASKSYSSLDEEEFKNVFLNAKAGLHRFNGYDESCSDWALRIERSASKDPVDRTTNPTVLPLTRVSVQGATHMETRPTYITNKSDLVHKVWWPVVSYRIGNTLRTAIVDTGTSTSVLQHDDDFPQNQFEQSGDDVLAVGIGNDLFRIKYGLLHEIRIGGEAFQDMLVNILHPDVFAYGQDIENLDILGMNLLLLYDSVCFAWKEQRLYLGELGPCANGLTVSASLSGRSELYIQIGTEDESRPWNAFFDTGAKLTYCSPEMFRSNDGHAFFADLNHELVGTCELADDLLAVDDDFLDPSLQSGILGLDTLQQFEAWGWKRGPLTSYFVRNKPKRRVD